MIRRPPRSTLSSSSAASDVYKRQLLVQLDNYMPPTKERHSATSTQQNVSAAFSFTSSGSPSIVSDRRASLPALFFPAAWVPNLPVSQSQSAEALAWMLAKMHVASADAQSHQLISHLLETHLVLETTLIAAHRAMSASHVVQKLLRPHFKGTLAINGEQSRVAMNQKSVME